MPFRGTENLWDREGTILVPRITGDAFGSDTSTYIDKDESNNMTFTDAVSGTWALADLIGGAAPRYKLNFVVDDWDLDGDYYKIDIEHELGEEHPQIEIYDGDDKVILDVVNVDADNLTIKVTADPDSRFDGIISIIRS